MSAYGGFALALAQSYLSGKTIKALLTSTTYTQDKDAHVNLSDLPAGYEIAASGSYTAGGVALANVTTTYDAASDTVKIDCDDIAFPTVTGPVNAAGVLYYVATGTATTSRLLGYDVFGSPITLSSSILTHQTPNGIFTLLAG